MLCIIYGALNYLYAFREEGAFVNGDAQTGGANVSVHVGRSQMIIWACVPVNGALGRGEPSRESAEQLRG